MTPVEMEGAEQVSMAWLLDAGKGAPSFAMRLFRIEPGGHTPRHRHSWEHEVYVVRGAGRVWSEGRWLPLEAGSFVLVLPDEEHQFASSENTELQFLCLIPNPTGTSC
jgi:quercetin dioxygenase-like cupin family protein